MTLPELWFIIIALLWTGFFILEGFDLGVGMLHGHVGRTEAGKRAAVGTIGASVGRQRGVADRGRRRDVRRVPRLVRDHVLGRLPARPAPARRADRARRVVRVPRQARLGRVAPDLGPRHDGGSVVVPLVIGIILGSLLNGLPIGKDQEFTGTIADLLQPYPIFFGAHAGRRLPAARVRVPVAQDARRPRGAQRAVRRPDRPAGRRSSSSPS